MSDVQNMLYQPKIKEKKNSKGKTINQYTRDQMSICYFSGKGGGSYAKHNR